MKIGFEAKRLFTNYTGLGNYSRFIVSALSSLSAGNEYFLYTPKQVTNGEVDEIVDNENIKVIKPKGIFRLLSSLWRSWGLSQSSSAQRLNVFHGLSQELPYGLPSRVRKVVTVHDLIFLRYPGFYNAMDVSIYKTKVKSACVRADRIIAISKQTAEDIVHFLKIDPGKIEVVYQGCHPNFKRLVNDGEKVAVRKKYNLPSKFILNVGTIERRKNILSLIEAMAILPADVRIPVVVVGQRSAYLRELVAKAEEKKVLGQIQFLHTASFSDFPAIYQQARVFVYPSLFEGFGIPLVEAIESGIPVITSTGSCFIEAAGPDAMYVDPHDPAALARDLERVLRDDNLRKQMVTNSRVYVQQFDPLLIATKLNNLYSQLCVTAR